MCVAAERPLYFCLAYKDVVTKSTKNALAMAAYYLDDKSCLFP